MRRAITAAKLISVWLFFISVNIAGAAGQSKGSGISISLSVNSTEFTKSAKPSASVTLVNRSGAPLRLDSLQYFGLQLELKGRPVTFCRIDECFNASVFPRGGKVANNASVVLTAKLYDLYWHNSISSIEAANHPKNLFTGVPPGNYALHAVVQVKADNSTAEAPLFFSIKSNVSDVTISRSK